MTLNAYSAYALLQHKDAFTGFHWGGGGGGGGGNRLLESNPPPPPLEIRLAIFLFEEVKLNTELNSIQ